MLEKFEIGILADNGDRETTRTLDEFGGQVFFAEGHGNSVGLCRYLFDSIADAAVVATAIVGCDDKQTVLDIEKRIAHI